MSSKTNHQIWHIAIVRTDSLVLDAAITALTTVEMVDIVPSQHWENHLVWSFSSQSQMISCASTLRVVQEQQAPGKAWI